MNDFVQHIITFIAPLFVGNIAHMIIVKRNYLPGLAKPLSQRLFGGGKTYRAFVVMPAICGLCSLAGRTLILHAPGLVWSFGIGFILGVVYLAAELPNSFIKRRMGIAPGQSHPKYRLLQYVIDKTDSLVPLCIAYYFLADISFKDVAILFAISFVIHVVFSRLLFVLKIKKSF